MPRLSKLLEKLEDTVEARWGVWFQRHKKKLPLYIPVGLVCWYFYGMLLNSMRLGIDAVFHNTGQDMTAIWIFDPIRNWLAIFSGFGLKATAFFALMFCLVTKRGYLWFSGYKYTRDPRGFDILPDGTHGSSGFLTKREMEAFLEIGPIRSVSGMLLGKIKRLPEDPDKYAAYVAHRMVPGENNNLLCIGAPGSWKTRGLILPFLMGCAQRKESVFCVDPKGELFEQLSPTSVKTAITSKRSTFWTWRTQMAGTVSMAWTRKRIWCRRWPTPLSRTPPVPRRPMTSGAVRS